MLIIEIARIPEEGAVYEGEEDGAILELEEDPLASCAGGVGYRLLAQRVPGELVLSGTVHAQLKLACARCGEFFSTTVADSSFLRAYEIGEGTESVDVTSDLREAILLYLPAFPQCKMDCAGLCPHCGANLNQGPCSCELTERDLRWDSLDSLDLE